MTSDTEATVSRILNAVSKLDAALDGLDDAGGLDALAVSGKARAKLVAALREARRAIDEALRPKANKDSSVGHGL